MSIANTNALFALISGGGVAWSLMTGRIFFKYAGTVTRDEQPLWFWSLIYLHLGLAAYCGYLALGSR